MNTPIQLAKWVKQDLYQKMTGHTVDTLKKLRLSGIFVEGEHFKSGLEGPRTFYYNHASIDDLLDTSPPAV